MYPEINTDGNIDIYNVTPEQAELLRAAVMQLAERTKVPGHAKTLRRIGLSIDDLLSEIAN